jgi:hypothetical protein
MANIPALVIGAAAGAVVSMAGGFLIASYATAGMMPGVPAAPIAAVATETAPWLPPDLPAAELADPLGTRRYATDRASGSSSE